MRPRFFPGGNIGDLAVNGTVNDLAVSGALPLALSVGAILEEGMALDELGVIAETMGAAARAAGVSIVTGDTKVVDSGHGDGVYLNTAGIGLVPAGLELGPGQVRPGDAVLLSGPIGMHGIAVLSVRDGLEFGADVVTDSRTADAGHPGAARRGGGGLDDARPHPRRGRGHAQRDRARQRHGDRDRRARRARARRRPRGLRLPRPGPAVHRQRGQGRGVRARLRTPSGRWR